MVFNATFNNISAVLWQSVLLVEETRVPSEQLPIQLYLDISLVVLRVQLFTPRTDIQIPLNR
jgi:hypothetical protein